MSALTEQTAQSERPLTLEVQRSGGTVNLEEHAVHSKGSSSSLNPWPPLTLQAASRHLLAGASTDCQRPWSHCSMQ